MNENRYTKIDKLSELPSPDENGAVTRYVFQYIDFRMAPQYVAAKHRFVNCCFMGCIIPTEMEAEIMPDCLTFPNMGKKYQAFASKLYTGETLYCGYDPLDEESYGKCFDSEVYSDYMAKGKRCNDLLETLARALHDRAISDAMDTFLSHFDKKQMVAVMGGHSLLRTDDSFRQVALISKNLTELGKVMASGGGPGAMEATHFGAWMAGRSNAQFDSALDILKSAPSFRDEGWLRTAFEVMREYPQSTFRSLGIPTWFYGHEPSTPFATDIAKFFMNSIREDILLSISKGGVIFSPGSAGTLQEIFQDAALNHYESVGEPSPMIFLGKDYYTKEIPVYTLLENLQENGTYKGLLLYVTDSNDEVINTIMAFSDADDDQDFSR